MVYRLAADIVILLHALFVLFVVFGGLLCLHRLRWAWLHLPAAVWGLWIEWAGWVCPLTPLENHFRQLAGEQGYSNGFLDHYLIPLLYPPGLDRATQWILGALVIFINLLIYGWMVRHNRHRARNI